MVGVWVGKPWPVSEYGMVGCIAFHGARASASFDRTADGDTMVVNMWLYEAALHGGLCVTRRIVMV
jgi:hypothetical protein